MFGFDCVDDFLHLQEYQRNPTDSAIKNTPTIALEIKTANKLLLRCGTRVVFIVFMC